MAKYILTKKAVDDLSGIWEYTSNKWSEYQADKYYEMLIDSFLKIADYPETGKSYKSLITGIYGFKTGKHIIFYRKSELENVQIEIIRILHEAMDIKNRLND